VQQVDDLKPPRIRELDFSAERLSKVEATARKSLIALRRRLDLGEAPPLLMFMS